MHNEVVGLHGLKLKHIMTSVNKYNDLNVIRLKIQYFTLQFIFTKRRHSAILLSRILCRQSPNRRAPTHSKVVFVGMGGRTLMRTVFNSPVLEKDLFNTIDSGETKRN